MRIGIIGGGVAGLAAAYELTKRGHFAEVFEQAPFLGGQASTFPFTAANWKEATTTYSSATPPLPS